MGKESKTKTKRRFHPFPVAQRKNRPHFSFGSVKNKMEIVNSQSDAKKQKKEGHEAHMIPGVDGQTVWAFPNTIISKLRYVQYLTLTSTTGSMASNYFRANSLFDPDQTGTGHQPLYRDTYASIYNHYKVLGAKITVRACHVTPETTATALAFGIVGEDDNAASSTSETRMEQSNSSYALIGKNSKATLFATFEPNEMFGAGGADDNTAMGSNATEEWYFVVWAASADGASSNKLNCIVEIDYTVRFAELVTPTQS
jgi:hypothetical protein